MRAASFPSQIWSLYYVLHEQHWGGGRISTTGKKSGGVETVILHCLQVN